MTPHPHTHIHIQKDAAWNVGFGWGDSHELGHNMQMIQHNIYYSPPGSGNRNMWSTLQNRATENSNNLFPYAVMWNFYRNFHNYTGEIDDDHMIGKVRALSIFKFF